MTAAVTSVGPYRIERELARGGMGVVYLAHDPRLGRTVALKALPADFAVDPERLERFAREARLLASLNHPNIGAIHDVVESDGHRYLALEHIEGESLAQRLSRGALSVSEALEICLQIAAGMEAAHERGVIHRDLKPGNVMITSGDQVKIVDFGLAKGNDAPEPGLLDSPALSSPTITSPAYSPGTIPGVILGTAPYLSPEQARGKAVDRRTDIWSWGCILYECLTGRRTFEGETVSDTVAAILKQEPDWSALPGELSPRLREVLRLCLEKDPRQRLRDIGDARLALRADDKPGTARRPMVRFRSRRVAIGFALGLAACVMAGVLLGTRSVLRGGRAHSSGTINLSIPVPADLKYNYSRITPDGRTILVYATPKGGSPEHPRPHLYRRDLGGRSFEGIPGTERATAFILSPDGKSVCFLAPISENSSEVRIYRVSVRGDTPVSIVSDFPSDRAGWAWADSKTLILTAASGADYVRVPLDGSPPSEPIPLAIPGMNASIGAHNGSNIYGRGVFLSTVTYERGGYHYGIGVLDLRTGKAKMLVRDGASARYAAGYLLFTRDSTLYAAPFNRDRLALTGVPIPVLTGLQVLANRASTIHVAPNGTLVYALGARPDRRRLAVVAGSGEITDWLPDRLDYGSIALSPDASRLVVQVTNSNLLDEIWVVDRRGRSLRRLVSDSKSDCHQPIWSADGSLIAFAKISRSSLDGIYVVPADGSRPPRRVGAVPNGSLDEFVFPLCARPGSAEILCLASAGGKMGLIMVSTDSGSIRPVEVGGATSFYSAQFSPDGRWIAYTSNESGGMELYLRNVRSDGTLGVPNRLSSGGATALTWSHEGKRIDYVAPGSRLMTVSIQSDGAFLAAKLVRELPNLRESTRPFCALPDGSWMALLNDERQDDVRQIEVTLNLFDALDARARQASR